MAARVLGHLNWGVKFDKDYHRDYGITWLVETDAPEEGPAIVANAFGLPSPGTVWAIADDYDPWAFCWPDWTIEPVMDKEPNCLWTVAQTFSTKPLTRCSETQFQNPLAEPPKINGGFTRFTEEAVLDRFGKPIKSSSHERFMGHVLEFDNNRANAHVEFNTLFLPVKFYGPYMNCVNDAPIWGYEKRCVRVNNFSWSRNVYSTCFFYYTVSLEIEVNVKTFDKVLPDIGHRVLGGWAPGSSIKPPYNPDAFDPKVPGTLMRDNVANFEPWSTIDKEKNGHVHLDGKGRPNLTGDPLKDGKFTVEKYEEANLLLLGLPPILF